MRQESQRLTEVHLNNLIIRGHFVPLLVELQFTHHVRVQTPSPTAPQVRVQAARKSALMADTLAHDKTYYRWINREWGHLNTEIGTSNTNVARDDLPFVRGAVRRMAYDSVAWLGFFVERAFVVSKVITRDKQGALDDDVSNIGVDDLPLKWLVSNRQSSSSESNALPPARGRTGHWGREW
jgi:hypothetical protein